MVARRLTAAQPANGWVVTTTPKLHWVAAPCQNHPELDLVEDSLCIDSGSSGDDWDDDNDEYPPHGEPL